MTVAMQQSLDYLSSKGALESLSRDLYWPKWDSPWWHILLLHEMGQVKRVPAIAIEALVGGLANFPCHIFPVQEGDFPDHLNPYSDSQCHCSLGNIYQALVAWGVDMDREVPWARPWFLRYQMPDGGYNCDNDAYRVTDECPSSMVATIAMMEAVLYATPREFTQAEEQMLDRAAHFLLERQLTLGSPTRHNCEEQTQAKAWTQLTFPRFYFYDVLRGLAALGEWSQRRGKPLPLNKISHVLKSLQKQPRHATRQAYTGQRTLVPSTAKTWQRKPATSFALLEEVSQFGSANPYLEQQWQTVLKNLPK